MSTPARDPNTAGTAALSPFSTPNHELRAPGPGEAHSPFTPTAAPGSQPAGSLSDPEDGPDPTFNFYIQGHRRRPYDRQNRLGKLESEIRETKSQLETLRQELKHLQADVDDLKETVYAAGTSTASTSVPPSQPNSPTPTATTPEASPAAPTTESTETTGPSVATNATEPSESRPAR
uniref:VP4 n=1 Tax=Budgerigar fledgling disease virus TaxID=1891747 RepID=B9A7H3_BFPYV|nr:agnoprotein 1a [Gammapolyomavirus avis]BAH22400.1 VP4 [Gammapolyomavirus avis]BAH22407.1 VP4 [Gammapolyomavirus avis]